MNASPGPWGQHLSIGLDLQMCTGGGFDLPQGRPDDNAADCSAADGAAAENGMLDAVRFLVEECGVSLTPQWRGNGILQHIEMSPNWNEQKGHRAVRKHAVKKLKKTRK